ncbi:NAD(P)H-dependent flavin oxidoreductase [Planococcus lenghuensis]|uniref:Probable nitronate monooxygenase n=1 Tax=Planococcus lenghuensis TaxID=2213202 RepID=A0A1Q2KV64_9BACL|nr:nitronate monooxygenase [Planococcus lenghuensis]AQQ52016.1 nitronate monooxygenase [Planococcus lenghuensis]
MITLKTDLCALLDINYPIIQAGMAGGSTTPELVAAVSRAGGLGTLGAAYMEPDAIHKAVDRIRGLTNKPFSVNFFASHPADDFSRTEEVQEVLKPFRTALGLGEPAASYSSPDRRFAQFNACLDLNIPVISTAFGLLEDDWMEQAKRQGIKVIVMVTTVEEALAAESAGADAVVAQGTEAGGHRGTFSLAEHPNGAQIGLMSLVPQTADALRIPVIAAGGIVDGRGLAASLILGASGVQAGTLFLTATEAGTHPAHKNAIFAATEESTAVTTSFSGRPARGIRNRFIEEFESTGVAPLPFPSQNTLTKELRAAAAKEGHAGMMSLWAGQSVRALKSEASAEAIIQRLVREAEAVTGNV